MPTDEDWEGYSSSDALGIGMLMGFRKHRRPRAIATEKRLFLSWKTPPRPDPLPNECLYQRAWVEMEAVLAERRPRVLLANGGSPIARALVRLLLRAYLSGMNDE
jgi:hypothetical protein